MAGVIDIMKIYKHAILGLAFFLGGCTVYTEKQSEAVSQNVYAANDAISKARVDLAQFYSNETTRFIRPPKHPIKINSIYEAGEVVKNGQKAEKTRVVIVPDQYKNDKVVIVGSKDYNQLLQDSATKKQLEEDNKNKDKQLQDNNIELNKQKQMSDKMIKDLNYYQKEVYKLRLSGLWKDIVIVALLLVIGTFIYIRVSAPKFL
jgi:hypothetical protein